MDDTTRHLEQLLAAIALDGHAVIVRSGKRLVERGDPAICEVLTRIALGGSPTDVTTERLSDGLVACGQQRCGVALVVAVPDDVSTLRVHARLSNVVAILASLAPPPSPERTSGPGGSGAPSEVSITTGPRRAN